MMNGSAGAPTQRQAVTTAITRLMAAKVLADYRFPAEDLLPQVACAPGANVGHQVLLDYPQLASILWGAALEIRRKYQAAVSVWRMLQVTLLAGVILLWVNALLDAISIGAALLVTVAIVVLDKILQPRCQRISAAIRARYIKSLLAGENPSHVDKAAKGLPDVQHWTPFGDGRLVDERNGRRLYPVLTALHRGDPFPGYGVVQIEKTFACPPATNAKQQPSAIAIQQALSKTLRSEAVTFGITELEIGSVVVIDGASLTMNSGWIDKDTSSPRLHANKATANAAARGQSDGSARVYLGLQLVLPEHMTCITFFIRVFLIGASVGCELCICTLGPPDKGWEVIQEAVCAYEYNLQDRYKLRFARLVERLREPLPFTQRGNRLRRAKTKLDAIGNIFSHPFELSPADIKAIDPMRVWESNALRREHTELLRMTPKWVGHAWTETNWRERHSLSMSNDFWGLSECRSAVRTLYTQVSKLILATLEQFEYDTSAYKDKEGQLVLNVDRIDQLNMGERIYMGTDKVGGAASTQGRKEQQQVSSTN